MTFTDFSLVFKRTIFIIQGTHCIGVMVADETQVPCSSKKSTLAPTGCYKFSNSSRLTNRGIPPQHQCGNGTDHLSFYGVGLPGFQFIEDPIEYDTRNHHSNMDVYDHLIEDNLKQIATIAAAFVYDAARRDAKLPRKELPEPRPAGDFS